MNNQEIKVGQNVSYIGNRYKSPEHGKVKSLHEDGIHAFVVYSCGGNWDEFRNYTGVITRLDELVAGWI